MKYIKHTWHMKFRAEQIVSMLINQQLILVDFIMIMIIIVPPR